MTIELSEIADRLAIQQLMYRYAMAVDGRDWELYRTVFSPDAVIDYVDSGGARADLETTVKWLDEVLGDLRRPAAQHDQSRGGDRRRPGPGLHLLPGLSHHGRRQGGRDGDRHGRLLSRPPGAHARRVAHLGARRARRVDGGSLPRGRAEAAVVRHDLTIIRGLVGGGGAGDRARLAAADAGLDLTSISCCRRLARRFLACGCLLVLVVIEVLAVVVVVVVTSSSPSLLSCCSCCWPLVARRMAVASMALMALTDMPSSCPLSCTVDARPWSCSACTAAEVVFSSLLLSCNSVCLRADVRLMECGKLVGGLDEAHLLAGRPLLLLCIPLEQDVGELCDDALPLRLDEEDVAGLEPVGRLLQRPLQRSSLSSISFQ